MKKMIVGVLQMRISFLVLATLEMGGLLMNGKIPSWNLDQIQQAGYGNYVAIVILILCVGAGQMILLRERPSKIQMMIGIPSFVLAIIVSFIYFVSTDTLYMTILVLSFIVFAMNWRIFIDVAKSNIAK